MCNQCCQLNICLRVSLLQIFSFHVPDTCLIYLRHPSPSYLSYIALLSPSYLFHAALLLLLDSCFVYMLPFAFVTPLLHSHSHDSYTI